MDKCMNRAIIGNKKIVASYSEKGELLRFCYPSIDGRQFIDFFHTGIKVNDSNIIYLHDDINNRYSQNYVNNTNILVTKIENKYFNIEIEQVDCVTIDEDCLIKKYTLKNNNSMALDVKFIVNSKILSNNIEGYGCRAIDNGIIQYNHNYSIGICSEKNISGHRINDVERQIRSGILSDKDYIGMSNNSAMLYDIGIIEPKQEKEICVYLNISDDVNRVEAKSREIIKVDTRAKIENVRKYWENYVKEHSSMDLKNIYGKKSMDIYIRTILLYPLLINYEFGGIAAALEVDEERLRSGGYRYCWTRDAIFITEAFDILKMEEDTTRFYERFCKNTQSDNGMWEQRFFTDGKLAPCWGYQVDETASVIYGIYKHYRRINNKDFLVNNLKMCENAIKFLIEYVDNILGLEEKDYVKKELKTYYKKIINPALRSSYDLWEMNEGIHLYSLSSIIAAFRAMINIYEELDNGDEKNSRLKKEKRNNQINKLNRYILMLDGFIRANFIDEKTKMLRRNLIDSNTDISVIGSIYPFEIFNIEEKVVENTVEKINMTLRTYRDGYLRFQNDSYMDGNKPWVITTLWMALYYIKKKEYGKAEKCFKYVVETSTEHGFLSEQVSNEDMNFHWVIGLGWSHAMFIIVANELLNGMQKED